VLVPYHLLWQGEEVAPAPMPAGRFSQLATLLELPALVQRLNAGD
jgi:hypothetical protein